MKPQFLIGSIGQGNGKTVLTAGLARALSSKGMKVQLYKSGADSTDTFIHTLATDTDSYNLDTWLASRNHIKYVYNNYGEKADVCIVEGNGGLFDGYKRMSGSGADIAQLLNIPVILLVNARMASFSIAPMIYGFRNFRRNVRVTGVIFNNVSSPSQYAYLKEVCREAGVECMGYLPYDEKLKYSSYTLIPTIDNRKKINELIEQVSAYVEQNVNVTKLLDMSTSVFPCEYSLPFSSEIDSDSIPRLNEQKIRISIARDPAFCLSYNENIDRLSRIGDISYFSPINSRNFPETDLLYLPDGYVELFVRQLHRRKAMLAQIKEYAEKGGKILAEGAGMLLLGRSVLSRSGNTSYTMSDVLPIDFSIEDAHSQVGIRKFEQGNLVFRGYEGKHPYLIDSTELNAYITVQNQKGAGVANPIYRTRNVIASLTRWYWGESDIMSLFR